MPHNTNNTADPTAGQAASPDILTFLRWLYGDDASGWLSVWTLPDKATGWYPAHRLHLAAKYALSRATTHDVYFGLGLRREQLPDGRGESKDVVAIPGLWIELDIKHAVHSKVNLPQTIDEALSLVREAIPLEPSLMVRSGYGIHPYWLFRELWILETDEERQTAYHLLHRLQATIQSVAKLHGWEVDSTFDLARVLRLPNTYNRKIPDDPQLVEIIEAHEDRRYNVSDFSEHLIEVDDISYQQTTSEAYAGELHPVELHTLKIPTWLKTLIRHGEDVNAAKSYPSRSEALFDAVQGLIKAGVDDQTSMSLLLDSRYMVSEKPREKGRTWLAGEITRARAKLNGHRPTATSNGQPQDGTGDEYNISPNGDIGDEQSTPPKPIIQLSTDMTAVVNKLERSIQTMPNAPLVFQRSRKLSVITSEVKPSDWFHRPPDAPAISPVEAAYLRELAAAAVDWQRYDDRKKDGEKWVKTLPPEWAIKTLLARPYSHLPILEGLISAPTLRPDGSILDAPGYDAKTGLYACFHRDAFPSIIQHPTIDDARQSIEALRDLYQDFRFAKPSHGSAALAAICSIVCRFAVVGCIPLFGVSATAAGSGKGLLVDAITMSATGRSAPRWAQTADNEEERKRLFAIAVEGDQVAHIDNVVLPLGSPALDMAITAGMVKERIMKTLTNDQARIYACFFASGNNLSYKGDLARRVVPLELDPEMERPEERTGFVYDPLLDVIQKRWPTLAVHALTIIRAFVVAGRPSQQVTPFGSFESWSKTIREALIWAQEPDPCEGRKDMRAENDIELDALRTLMVCWQDCYQQQEVSSRKVVQDIKLYTAGDGITKWLDLQEALKTLSRSQQDRLTSIQVGYVLRGYKGRVVGGHRFIRVSGDEKHPGDWKLANC